MGWGTQDDTTGLSGRKTGHLKVVSLGCINGGRKKIMVLDGEVKHGYEMAMNSCFEDL